MKTRFRLAAALAIVCAVPGAAVALDTVEPNDVNFAGHRAKGLPAPAAPTEPLLYGGHAAGSFPASTSGLLSDTNCPGANFLPQWTGSAWTCTSATGALFGTVGPLSLFGNATSGSSAPGFFGPGTAGEVPIVNQAGTSIGWGLIPQTSITAPYATKGIARTFFIDYDGGSDSNDCLTSSTPCKTLDGGVAPKVPTDLGGGSIFLRFLPRASCAAYVKADGTTIENFSTLNSLVNGSSVIVEGDWFRTGSTPSFGMSTIPTGTNAAGYDVSSYSTPTWGPTITVTIHGGGAPSFPSETSGSTSLLGYQWRWDPATTTAALRGTTTTLMGTTTNTVTLSSPPVATPVAGDFGYIEAPCFTIGSASVGASFPGGAGLNSLYEFFGVSATALNVNSVSDVVLSRVVASSGGGNFAHTFSVGSSSRFWGGLTFGDVYGPLTINNTYVGLLQVNRGAAPIVSQYTGSQILLDGVNGPGAVTNGFGIGGEAAASVNIGDVPGATTHTQSRLITVGTNVAGIYSFWSNIRVGSINWEESGTPGLFFPVNFIGHGNTIYIDGITDTPPHGGSPSSWAAPGIIDLQPGSPVNAVQPPHDNNIVLGPHQTGLADASRLNPNADIHLSSVSPLDGTTRVQYTLQLDTLKYMGAVTTGDGNRFYSYASNGLASVKAWSGLWDPDLTIPTGPPVTNDLGRFRVARASSTPGLLVLADGSSAANSANVVGVNIDSLPDPSGTNYDRYGSPLIVSEGIVPIITQDASPTIPSPVWLSPQYPRGVVTTVKPATNAVQVGVAIADLGAFTENLQGQVPPELTTVTGRLLRVQLGPLNATTGGSISGPLGSISVNAINDSGGAAHAIGSISASQIMITDASAHVTTASTIPWTDISGAPTFLGDPGGNGIVVRTASGTTVARTLTSTGVSINVTNGTGVSGNPNVEVNLDGVTLDQGVGGVVQVANAGIGTTQLASSAVTYPKIQNETAATLLGNPGASAAAPSEITLGAHCSFTSAVLDCSGGGGSGVTSLAATDPVTVSASTGAVTIGSKFDNSTITLNVGGAEQRGHISGGGLDILAGSNTSTISGLTISQIIPPTGTGLWGITSGASDAAATVVSTGLTRAAGNLTVNLSTGVAGGQTAIGGTVSGNALTLTSNTSHDGRINLGNAGTSYYDEANSILVAPVGGLTTPGLSFAGFTTDGFSTILSGARISAIVGGVRQLDILNSQLIILANAGTATLSLGGSSTTGISSSGTAVFVNGVGGSVNFATTALSPSFTTGYMTLPSTAGVPTGTPATIPSGQIPIVVDSTDDRLYFRNASWKPYGQYTGGLASGPLCNTTTTGLWSACTVQASGSSGGGSVQGPGAYITALTGDGTASGPGSAALSVFALHDAGSGAGADHPTIGVWTAGQVLRIDVGGGGQISSGTISGDSSTISVANSGIPPENLVISQIGAGKVLVSATDPTRDYLDTKFESTTGSIVVSHISGPPEFVNLNLPNVGTPGTYGGVPQYISAITTDAQGRVSSVTATNAQHATTIPYSLQTLNTTAICGGWLFGSTFESGSGCGGGFSSSAVEFPTGGLVPQTVRMQVQVTSLTMSGTYNLKLVVTRNGTAISPTACNFSSSSGAPPFMCDQGGVGVSGGASTDVFGVEAVATGSGTASAIDATINLTVQDY